MRTCVAITTAVNGLDVMRCGGIVVERAADFANTRRHRRVGDNRIGPDCRQQFVLRYQLAATLHQMPKDRKRFRRQLEATRPLMDGLIKVIQPQRQRGAGVRAHGSFRLFSRISQDFAVVPRDSRWNQQPWQGDHRLSRHEDSMDMRTLRNETVAAFLLASTVFGVTPSAASDGTLKNRSHAVTWSGTIDRNGPPDAGVPECATTACHRFDLHVRLPAGVWNQKPGGLQIALQWFTDADNLRL